MKLRKLRTLILYAILMLAWVGVARSAVSELRPGQSESFNSTLTMTFGSGLVSPVEISGTFSGTQWVYDPTVGNGGFFSGALPVRAGYAYEILESGPLLLLQTMCPENHCVTLPQPVPLPAGLPMLASALLMMFAASGRSRALAHSHKQPADVGTPDCNRSDPQR